MGRWDEKQRGVSFALEQRWDALKEPFAELPVHDLSCASTNDENEVERQTMQARASSKNLELEVALRYCHSIAPEKAEKTHAGRWVYFLR